VKAGERAVAIGAFPLVLGGALALALGALERGWDPEQIVAVALLERLYPHHRSWLHSRGDLRVDLAHVVSVTLTSNAAAAVAALAGVALVGQIAQPTGTRHAGVWPTQWPLLAQLPLALVVAELPKYWHHRLQHETDLLWRFHATHHSCPRLYFLNATRFHPVDIAIDGFLGVFALLALGAGEQVYLLFAIVSAVHGYFQHANLRVSVGPLNYVFSMAELHRWHHSPLVRESKHNYGQNVIFWDLVFGTFFWPRDREPPEDVGIPELPAFPMTFWRQLASPLRWRRIRDASRARLASTVEGNVV